MTTSPHLVSPLSKGTPTYQRRNLQGTSVARVLFPEPSDSSESTKTLSELYQFNLDTPGILCDGSEFFEIREAVEAIEAVISRIAPPNIQDELRTRVTRILRILGHSEKLAELGMVLFYLDRDRDLPESSSLVSFRSKELNEEVKRYIEAHRSAGANPLIPSGKTHYLMRAFSHMALTSSQVYNRGGLAAIQQLLNDPSYQIAIYLQPEHLQHLVAVIGHFLSNPAFKALIETPATIHPDLKDIIRLDLKLHPEHPIRSTHILYDAIMSMFTDIRQKEAPNCYAIAALIYTIENDPLKYLEMTLRWLKQGYASFGERFALPIKPLVEKRFLYVNDLNCRLKFEDTIGLAPFQHISGTLGLGPTEAASSDTPVSIRSTLSRLLQENDFSEHLPYAERMYIAYKINGLILVHLAIGEMTFMNISRRITPDFPKVSTVKRSFITACLSEIAKIAETPVPQMFRSKLIEKLTSVLWLENCNEQQVDVKQGAVWVRAQRVANFTGDLFRLASVFESSLRVFAFSKNKYTLINTISDLQQTLVETSRNTVKEAERGLGSSFERSHRLICNAVNTHAFRVHISNYCSHQIKERKISGVHLNKADLLLLKQVGGLPDDVLKLVYGIDVSIVEITDNNTPYQLVRNLLRKIPVIDTDRFTTARKVLLFAHNHHIWTLNPYSWRFLMSNRREFHRFIEETVFKRVKRKMNRPVPQQIINKAIDRCTVDRLKRRALQSEFQECRDLTYHTFASKFVHSKHLASSVRASEVINEVYEEIWVSKQSLSGVLRRLNLRISRDKFHMLYDALSHDGAKPYVLARQLRKKMIEFGISIKHPYDIEHALCESHNEPLTFPIGDSNWLHDYTEDPYHVELCIGYHYEKNTLVLKNRYKDFEEIDTPYRYSTIEIQYPPDLSSR